MHAATVRYYYNTIYYYALYITAVRVHVYVYVGSAVRLYGVGQLVFLVSFYIST